MPVRHPPTGRVPAAPQSRGTSPRRVVKYTEPETPWWRRLLRQVFRPPVILLLIFVATVSIGVLGYYWLIFSARIDSLLKGEVFTRSAGIYAAPRELHNGAPTGADDIVDYLRHAGYVDKTQQADSSRGRFSFNGNALDVEPSTNSTVDGHALFPRLRIQFSRGGKGISAISDLQTGARYDRAELEPELLSSVAGKERTKRRVIGFNDIP